MVRRGTPSARCSMQLQLGHARAGAVTPRAAGAATAAGHARALSSRWHRDSSHAMPAIPAMHAGHDAVSARSRRIRPQHCTQVGESALGLLSSARRPCAASGPPQGGAPLSARSFARAQPGAA